MILGKDELGDYLQEIFPQIKTDFVIETLDQDTISMRLLAVAM